MPLTTINTLEQLDAIYGRPNLASTVKETDRVTPHYRAMIETSPFAALATVGPEGVDCSPRGDAGSVVRVQDPQTLLMPDRRGNNRADSLRNIVRDPRCAFLFLIPGSGACLRVNSMARVVVDPQLLASFAVDGQAPRSVVVLTAQAVYFQCARAIVRSDLWNPARHIDPGALPTPGEILADLSAGREGGPTYDRDRPERARKTLW
jgi:PPOX class probable FMN-dependent enzyme